MRLLVVYQHAPTPGAPGIYRHRTLLAELARRGWHVDLVSSPINYMQGSVPEQYRGRVHVREEIDGVHHHWVWAVDDVHRNMRRRAANYASFAASATTIGAGLKRPDVIWASSPPLSVASVGATLARRFRRPWVLEVRDLWPESAAQVGLLPEDGRLYRTMDRLARRYASRADGVLVPTPGLVDLVGGHGARDVTLVTGSIGDHPTDPAVRAQVRARLGVRDDQCLFAYVGAHGIVNGLDALLDAAERLGAAGGNGAGGGGDGGGDGSRGDDRGQFVLAGDGSAFAQLQARLAERPVASVRLLGPVPKAEVLDLVGASDVCLHMLRPDPLFESALPTKVLEYLGAHRAFITTVPGLPQRLALESGGGFAADVDGLVGELRRWVQMPASERVERGEQAFAYGAARYGLDANVDRLEELLMRTAARRGPRPPANGLPPAPARG